MKLPTIKSINDWFDSLPLVVKVLDWSKKRSFPGFFGVPIYEVIIFMYQEMKSVSLSGRANSIAYSFFLSVFPSIIVLLTLLPLFTEVVLQYIPEGDHFFDVLYREIKFIMPGSARWRAPSSSLSV